MQVNHCDGVLSNYWNTLIGQQISQHTAISMSRSLDTKIINWTFLLITVKDLVMISRYVVITRESWIIKMVIIVYITHKLFTVIWQATQTKDGHSCWHRRLRVGLLTRWVIIRFFSKNPSDFLKDAICTSITYKDF